MDLIEIAILAIIIVVLVATIHKPNFMRFVTLAMAGITYHMYVTNHQRQNSEMKKDGSLTESPGLADESSVEPPDISNSEKSQTYSPGPCAEQRNEPAPLPPADATTLEAISRSNLFSLNQIYGRRYGGTIDDALYVHKQRIGDRDRQATINQVRSRRNNVYEPYYRQELSEHNSKRWWEPDDVLVTKLERRQLDTIDMGRSAVWDADIDGIYGQQ